MYFSIRRVFMTVPEQGQEPNTTEPEQTEKSDNAPATLWVSKSILAEYKKAVKLLATKQSDDLNTTLQRRIAEVKGLTIDPNSPNVNNEAERLQRYEVSKKRVFDLQLEIPKMVKSLKDQNHWSSCLHCYIKYIDYDHKFDSLRPRYSFSDSHGEKDYEEFCLQFIEQASDQEADFKRETTRFLMNNKRLPHVYYFVGLVEKLQEIRKQTGFMLQYHADMLGKEEYAKLEEQERQKREAEAKAEEQKRLEKEELERKHKDEEEKRFEAEWKEHQEEEDSEEEEDNEKENEEDTEETSVESQEPEPSSSSLTELDIQGANHEIADENQDQEDEEEEETEEED